MFNIISI